MREGEILGLVGESGSGKSVTATAILRLIRKPGRLTQRQHHAGRPRPVRGWTRRSCSKIRGTEIAMISQTPRTALNPLITVGQQVARLFVLHAGLSKAESRQARHRDAGAGRAFPSPSGAPANMRTSSPAACASA